MKGVELIEEQRKREAAELYYDSDSDSDSEKKNVIVLSASNKRIKYGILFRIHRAF